MHDLMHTRPEAQVHEHCWTVVRWAILAIGSGDSAARMLRFYSRLLEHFMGVDPRSPDEVHTFRHLVVASASAAIKVHAQAVGMYEMSFCTRSK